MVTRRLRVALLMVGALPVVAQAQSLERVPDFIQGDLRQELLANRARVEARIDDFNRRATSFNSRCQGLPTTHPNAAACQREGASLSQEAGFIERDKSVYNASVASAAAAHNDAMVVDTRGLEVAGMDLVNQVPQLRGSAGATAMAKGFQALIRRDWQLTLAWWETAQLRDPLNPAIAAGVDMARWTIAYHRRQGMVTTLSEKRASRAVPSTPGWYLDHQRRLDAGILDEALRMLEQAVERAEGWPKRNKEPR